MLNLSNYDQNDYFRDHTCLITIRITMSYGRNSETKCRDENEN